MIKTLLTIFIVAKALVHLLCITCIIFNWDSIKEYQKPGRLSTRLFKNPVVYFLCVYFLLFGYYLSISFDLDFLYSYIDGSPSGSIAAYSPLVTPGVISPFPNSNSHSSRGKPLPAPYSFMEIVMTEVTDLIKAPSQIIISSPIHVKEFISHPDSGSHDKVVFVSNFQSHPSWRESFDFELEVAMFKLFNEAMEFLASFNPNIPEDYKDKVEGPLNTIKVPKYSKTHICIVYDFLDIYPHLIHYLMFLTTMGLTWQGSKLRILVDKDRVPVGIKWLLPKGLSFYKTIYFLDSNRKYPHSIKDFKDVFNIENIGENPYPMEDVNPYSYKGQPSPLSLLTMGNKNPFPLVNTGADNSFMPLKSIGNLSAHNRNYSSIAVPPVGGGVLPPRLIIVSTTYDKHLRCLDISMYNSDLLEGLDLIKGIYNTLYTSSDWLGFSYIKILLSTLHLDNGSVLSAHPNRLVHNGMDVDEFIDTLVPFAPTIDSAKYSNGFPETISVRSWSFNHPDNVKITGRLMPISVISRTPSTILANTSLVPCPIVPRLPHWFLDKKGYSTKATPSPISPKGPTRVDLATKLTPFSTLELSLSSHKVTFNRESLALPLDVYKPATIIQREFLYPISIAISSPAIGPIGSAVSPNTHSISTYYNIPSSNSSQFDAIMQIKIWGDAIWYLINSKPIWGTKRTRHVVFVHDLGLYGIFIYKYLHLINNAQVISYDDMPSKGPWLIEPLVDKHNKFIAITLKIPILPKGGEFKVYEPGTKPVPKFKTLIFKDSMRIFPVSINELSELFTPDNFNLGKISLYDALHTAQTKYLKDYSIDIAKATGVVSTSTLAYKIFIKNFSKSKTPIGSLKLSEDLYIRPSYQGGSTDLYKGYGENLYWYDVNSLYPTAMKMPMPIKVKGFIENMTNLDDFFGFCKAEIMCPAITNGGPIIPVLPNKIIVNGVTKTVHPRGIWEGNYFSEELKACAALGYIIKPIHGISFEEGFLFNKYVDHFYKIKSRAKGAEKAIAKLCLNSLYGYFGRPSQELKTIEIYNQDLEKFLAILDIKSIIKINEEKSLLLINKGFNNKNLKQLKSHGFDIPKLIEDLNKTHRLYEHPTTPSNAFGPGANVAIASAITAYARMLMHKFKNEHTLYTDTDSVFTSIPLPSELVGKELGLMKDELEGKAVGPITRAYFFGLKQYAFQYKDLQGNTITKTTFAGIPKDALSWEQVEILAKGGEVKFVRKDSLFSEFNSLNVSVKNITINIKIKSP